MPNFTNNIKMYLAERITHNVTFQNLLYRKDLIFCNFLNLHFSRMKVAFSKFMNDCQVFFFLVIRWDLPFSLV